MNTVALAEAKNHLSKLVDDAAAGAEIIIAKHGRPVAKLVAVGRCTASRFGAMKGKLKVPADFDQALSADVLALFEGKD